MKLNDAQLATVLAALRYYQGHGLGDPTDRPLHIHDIATDGDTISSLNSEGIDELCELLNCEPDYDGTVCPHCGSDQIEGDGVRVESPHAFQEVWCLECEKTWTDVYKLTGFNPTN